MAISGGGLITHNERVAMLVDSASEQLKRVAEHIRQRGTEEIIHDIAAFAQRRPAVFIGAAFLVGVGIGRFLKSSAQPFDVVG
jgi:hypothetical protein